LKESCDCDVCVKKEICKYCNNWIDDCECADERCSTCNEHFINYGEEVRRCDDCCPSCNEHFISYGGVRCYWDHTKPLCHFCNLPILLSFGTCANFHIINDPLCEECSLPELYGASHAHDNTLCKKCGSLLNHGSCIYNCVNGGNRCVHCYWEGVVNNVCRNCHKEQTGQLTKAAIK